MEKFPYVTLNSEDSDLSHYDESQSEAEVQPAAPNTRSLGARFVHFMKHDVVNFFTWSRTAELTTGLAISALFISSLVLNWPSYFQLFFGLVLAAQFSSVYGRIFGQGRQGAEFRR